MKRLSLVIALLAGFQMMAQEGPTISSAVIAMDRTNDIPAAKKYIDEAAKILSTKDMSTVKWKNAAKFYYYQGLINFRIHQSEDEAIKALEPKALDIAAESFSKSIEYETAKGKSKFLDRSKQQLPYVANAIASRGIEKDKNKDPLGAYQDFQKTYDLNLSMGRTDTNMLYNTAVMAQKAEMFDKAIEINEKLIDFGYKGVEFSATTTDEKASKVVFNSKKHMESSVATGKYKDPKITGDYRADIFLATAGLYKRKGDTATYDKFIKEGRVKFPDNEAIIRAELQKFLETKEYDKAMVNLDLAIAKDPKSHNLLYIKGNILQTTIGDLDAAVVAYDRALALKPDYLDPLYMKGLMNINEANRLTKEMNDLPLNATKKYNALKAQQKAEFEKALPLFKKAHEIDPKDRETLNALKEVYFKLKMVPERLEVEKKIAAIEAGL